MARKPSPMARFRPFLLRLLVAVLLWQSGVAAAHGMRGMAGADGMLVEICSTDGIRTIRLDAHRLDAQGDPLPDHAPEAQGGFCPICHGLPGITLPEPPRTATPAWLGTAITWQVAGTELVRPPARALPYATRAPPVSA